MKKWMPPSATTSVRKLAYRKWLGVPLTQQLALAMRINVNACATVSLEIISCCDCNFDFHSWRMVIFAWYFVLDYKSDHSRENSTLCNSMCLKKPNSTRGYCATSRNGLSNVSTCHCLLWGSFYLREQNAYFISKQSA